MEKYIISFKKKAYNVSLLPNNIDIIYNHVYYRIFRVIGSFSLLLVVSNSYSYSKLLFPLDIIVLILALVQSVQMILISIIKTIYGSYIILYRPDLFEIRN